MKLVDDGFGKRSEVGGRSRNFLTRRHWDSLAYIPSRKKSDGHVAGKN